MMDRWGPDGPPEEAYSRVTRDLRAVFAELVQRLAVLPAELEARYDAVLRTPTPAESTRFTRAQPHWPVDGVSTLVPSAEGASPLVVARWDADDGGTGAVVGLGDRLTYVFPSCWCDACDTDSAEVIDDLERYVDAVTGGFTEYRSDGMLGFRYDGGGQASGPAEGPEFVRDWAPWGRRSGSPDGPGGG